ncbi:MAG: peptide ABC transporter substrate-binding protein [Candidatus Pelethousia sp.]|nr:peptide ABC transporter substrate-binding protein [Candidatus Pelethousia sp.]
MKNIKSYMRTNWIRRLGALLLALLSLLCCACGKKTGTEKTEDTALLATPTPAVQPLTGGEIRLPMPLNADITDPLRVNTEEMLSLFSLIYEGLISVNETGKLTAELAESWTGDSASKVWTFTLRSGVKWHDGDAFTAYDVTATFTRLKEIGAESYYAYQAGKIESMRAVDEQTLEVTMEQGGYASLYALAFPVMEGGQAAALPVGTGPFKLESWTGQEARLVANTAWWKQRPYLDAITFVERDSNDTALASYQAGQLDMVPSSNTGVGRYRSESTTVLDVMTQTAELLLINNNNATLRDISIRKALSYAMDRGKIISNIYMNRAQPCDVPIPPDSWIYESKSKVYDYNLAKARELLTKAGWVQDEESGLLQKDGRTFTVRLLVNDSSDTTRKEAANLLSSQLTELGMKVELTAAPYALGQSQTQSEYLQKLSAGDYDLCLIGINLGRDGDLTPVMNPLGTAHYGNYSVPELTAMAENILTAKDETAYREALSAFQLKFVEELPFIVLYFRLNSVVYSSNIKGLSGAREPDILYTVDKWYINQMQD